MGDVQTVKNLFDTAYGVGLASVEHIASSILKTKMEQKNIGGKPLPIVAGTEDKKSDSAGLNQVSFGTIMELIKCLELSQHQNKKCVLYLERVLGFKVGIKEFLKNRGL